jgi:hypothetical protein
LWQSGIWPGTVRNNPDDVPLWQFALAFFQRELRCPRCEETTNLRSSHQPLPPLIERLGFHPYRCRACQRRFVSRVAPPPPED